MTWEQFLDMFCKEYFPLVEQVRLVQDYLSLKQMTKLVSEITNMFMERALFFPEYDDSEQVQML